MVARLALVGCLITGMVMISCAPLGTRQDGQAGLFGKRIKKEDDGPPTPAPALYIPGPTAVQSPGRADSSFPPIGDNLPASAPAPVPSGSAAPALPLVSAQALAQTEILPLQVPPLANPIVQAGGVPPPRAATAQSIDPDNAVAPLRELYLKAAQKHASMDSYALRLRRREVVGTQSRPEEILLCKFRKEPWSVYFKWLGQEGKGREVVYVRGRYESALHTLTAAGDIPLLPAGKHIKLSPDGIMVRAKSRYPITDAGLGGLIERFGRMVEALEKGDIREGGAKYLGLLKRPEYENKVEAVLQTVPPKSDPNLPRGGQRLWFFVPSLQLPMLIITQDETGREVEYYCHDRFMFPVNFTDDDFNPDLLWKNAQAN